MEARIAQAERVPATAVRARLPRLVRALVKNPPALFGAVVVTLVLVSGLLAPALAPYDPNLQDIPARLKPPMWSSDTGRYVLGTDSLGRDILSRVLYGTRISLLIGVSAVLGAGVLGVALGLLAGYYRGWVDSLLMQLVDIWMSIPFLVMSIAIVTVLGPSLVNLVIVLALTGWVTFARVVRSQVLAIREGGYVEAARAAGASDWRIIVRHILPNTTTSILVIATLLIAQMITMEAALSFLGIGIQPPQPAWGSMVAEGKDVVAVAWWLSAIPGIVIAATVLAINLFGDWLRDVLDPRLRV